MRSNEKNGPDPWTNAIGFRTEAITLVTLVFPTQGATSLYTSPELIIENSPNYCDYELRYDFEIYSDQSLTQKITSVCDLPQGQFELTSWSVTVHLPEGVDLYWRSRATAGQLSSVWSGPEKFRIDTSQTGVDVYAEKVLYCGVTCPQAVIYRDCQEALGYPNAWSEPDPESPDGFFYHGFVSLGIRGSIILDMGEGAEIVDEQGIDLKIWQSISREQFQVFVAQQAGGPYYDLGIAGTGWAAFDDVYDLLPWGFYPVYEDDSWCYTTSNGYNGEIACCDVFPAEFEKIRFVRILDQQPWEDLRKDCYYFDEQTNEWLPYLSAGSDIDGVKAINCALDQ